MGKIEQGILGAFSGTVGTVVGSSWRGINYMRGKNTTKRHVTSINQDMQRARFQKMVSFIRKLSAFVAPGYRRLAIRMTAANAALSYNLKNGITGLYPDYDIAYNMILLSRGDLPNAGNPLAEPDNGGKIIFSWIDNAGSGKALSTDLVLTIAYCIERNMAITSVFSVDNVRELQQLDLDVIEFAGLTVETYISFFSLDGKEIADSIYTGQHTVLP